ncbi:hypothetical protein TSUD_177610 [Trifolium subterraneum]|uniref:3'-5' exonuclease domain-containing protein n=1 Tax=Trifolium subterraneum TaxID=3900 RepID=A0A2Z6PJK2_TRISU|nr:hypothetical protein TSUD_177610 [Trifolium subterraneum]
MTITIVDYDVRDYSLDKYDVVFHSETIHTMLTHSPSNLPGNSHNSSSLVGLDVEWLPNRQRNMDNPVAIIQLCINRECLIFQILRTPFIPHSLVAFLENQGNTFVGVGIKEDVEKLHRDYSLRVANFVELRTLATERIGEDMRGVGLKTLAGHVLGKDIEKPRKITMSRWDKYKLTPQQVQYACIDAFASFEIGRILYARSV